LSVAVRHAGARDIASVGLGPAIERGWSDPRDIEIHHQDERTNAGFRAF